MGKLYTRLEEIIKQAQRDASCIYSEKSNASADYSGTRKKYLNLTIPCLRKIAKDFCKNYFKKVDKKEQIALVERLFKASVHEHFKIAAMLLYYEKKLIKELQWKKLFEWLGYAQGWDEVDQYAYVVLGDKLLGELKKQEDALANLKPLLLESAKSNNLALKRGVLVVFIKALRKCEDKTYQQIKALINELISVGKYASYKDPVIKKAVKWAERVIKKREGPQD